MADVRINAQSLGQIASEDVGVIEKILRRNRLLGADETLVADDGVPEIEGAAPSAEGSLCKIACDALQAAAIEECNRLSGGAKSVCIVAAQAAGEECRKRC